MRSFSAIFYICLQNVRKWQKDHRIYLIALLLFLLVYDNVRIIRNLSESIDQPASIWIYPFLYTQYHQKLIFTIPLLLLFSNAPFIDGNSMYIISRCKKITWHLGQFLYIIFSSAVYYIFIFVCSVILLLPFSELSWDWGSSLKTISTASLAANSGYNFLSVPPFTIEYFTPVQAVWFTFLMSFLMASMLGMIIYFLNIVTNTKYIGCTAGGILIVYSCFVENYYTNSLMRKYSPVTWITVDKLDVGGMTHNPTFPYCVTMLLTTFAVLGITILLFRKKLILDTGKR